MSIGEILPPTVEMLDVIRKVGYSIESAIADMVDNCITANAKNIHINMNVSNKENYWLSVEDDGHGMTKSELIENLKISTKKAGGLYEDKEGGLGRFGIGAKLASLSFAKSVTVYTKKNGILTVRRWDRDHIMKVRKYQLLKKRYGVDEFTENHIDKYFEEKKSGTIFLCEKLDGFLDESEIKTKDNTKLHVAVLKKRSFIRDYLLMTHCEYLKKGDIKIVVQNNPTDMIPWDPFCTTNKKTKVFPAEFLKFKDSKCKLTGYILPKINEFSSLEKRKNAEGYKGWIEHQGIYIFREKRLLGFPTWCDFKDRYDNPWKKDKAFDRIRIRLDIPRELDKEFSLNVQKTSAKIPHTLVNHVQEYAIKIKEEIKKQNKPKIIVNKDKPLECWINKKFKNGSVKPIINRRDRVIKYFIENNFDIKDEIEKILKHIENKATTVIKK